MAAKPVVLGAKEQNSVGKDTTWLAVVGVPVYDILKSKQAPKWVLG